MSCRDLETKFARIGARMKLDTERGGARGSFALDVEQDGEGEHFTLRTLPRAELRIDVVDARPAQRHLLLLVEEDGRKQKFLCGHDERHWFVAAVPDAAGVRSVETAMEALKPRLVRGEEERAHLKRRDRLRRKNEVSVRQGEWFFVPAPGLRVDEAMVLRNEPLSRGAGSKPHTAEFCFRTGGEAVYVCSRFRTGVSEAEHRRIIQRSREAKEWDWQVQRRNPVVYVRGRVSHADHKTIVLRCWHRVLMNTENEAPAMRHVAFMD